MGFVAFYLADLQEIMGFKANLNDPPIAFTVSRTFSLAIMESIFGG